MAKCHRIKQSKFFSHCYEHWKLTGLKNWGLVRPPTLGCSSYLLTMVSHSLCSVQVCKRQRARDLCTVSSDNDIKLIRVGPHPYDLINLNYYFLTGPSPTESHWRLSLQHMNLGVGGDTNIQSITILNNTEPTNFKMVKMFF